MVMYCEIEVLLPQLMLVRGSSNTEQKQAQPYTLGLSKSSAPERPFSLQ